VTGTPSLTIGIPFLNARPTLADAVRSVLAQTYADWELLLVDDGSTDGSLAVAHAIHDARVRVVSDGANCGLVARLNQIAALARGRYLARMDADDLMHPERLERQVRFLNDNPGVDVVGTATFTIDEANAPIGIRGERPLDCDARAVLQAGLLIHPTVTGRTAWFRQNPYDARFVRAEDHELWVRTCRQTAFARLREPLFFYRESLSGNLQNYLRSAATVREIIRTYGPAVVGRFGTALLLGRSRLKSWTYWALTKLGCQSRLIRARTRRLTGVEADLVRATLRSILQIQLPVFERVDHESAHEPDCHAELPPAARLHRPADAAFSRPPSEIRAEPGG
jgi:glycosyltransferase involved in cell wall biosynthesis